MIPSRSAEDLVFGKTLEREKEEEEEESGNGKQLVLSCRRH